MHWTFICRPNNILDYICSISPKFGGGKHILEVPHNYDASCWNVNWSYSGSVNNAISFEFIHPEYENVNTVKLYNTYNL
jgi:hypothetical protein